MKALTLAALVLMQDDLRGTVKKALGNVRGPRVAAEIRLEREGNEEDRFICECWEKSQKAGFWYKVYFKGARKSGSSIEWYEAADAQKGRSVYLRKGDAWEKQKDGLGRDAAYQEFQAVKARLPELSKLKLDTLDAADEIWKKVSTEKKDGRLRVTFPGVDGRIGGMIELFYDSEDEVHEFVVDPSKLSVVLEIDPGTGKLCGADCVTHYASRDGRKNFTIRYACRFLEEDPKQKLPE